MPKRGYAYFRYTDELWGQSHVTPLALYARALVFLSHQDCRRAVDPWSAFGARDWDVATRRAFPNIYAFGDGRSHSGQESDAENVPAELWRCDGDSLLFLGTLIECD